MVVSDPGKTEGCGVKRHNDHHEGSPGRPGPNPKGQGVRFAGPEAIAAQGAGLRRPARLNVGEVQGVVAANLGAGQAVGTVVGDAW
jgi:hypothetical protein